MSIIETLPRALLLLAAAVFAAPAAFAAAKSPSPFAAKEVAEARRLIREGRAECVVIRNGKLHVKRGRGVMPLLEFRDDGKDLLRGATVADKVIGRAAAAILIAGGARAVYGETMSEDGRAYLRRHGIRTSCGKLVPRILNADRSGLCPLEQSVKGVDDPELAVRALRKRIAELRAKAKARPAPVRPRGDPGFNALLRKRWKEAGLTPVKRATDAEFLRRAQLKLTGRPPAPEEVRAFLRDKSPDKRARLIERLIYSPRFADMMAMRYAQTFRVKSEFPINMWPNAVQLFHAYLRDAAARDLAYDVMARELLTSNGSNFRKPQVNFLRGHADRTPEGVARGVMLSLAGVRLEKLPERDREGVAAFFSRLGRKDTDEWKEEIVFTLPQSVRVEARTPDGKSFSIDAPGTEPREVFAAWLTSPDNPYFARAFVNRMWFWLMGRGFVEPADDLAVPPPSGGLWSIFKTAPPPVRTTPELDALAELFKKRKYRVRELVRIICNSPAFDAGWETNDAEQLRAAELFAVYPVHRLEPEVLVDTLAAVTGTYDRYRSVIPEPFTILPPGTPAVKIADGSISSGVLDNFGRSPRDSGTLDETRLRITSSQRQWLMNSNILFGRLRRVPQQLFKKRKVEPARRIDEIYLLVLARYPTAEERELLLRRFREIPKNRRGSFWGDVVWALVNSREFMMYH